MDSLATTLLSTNLPPTDLQSDSVRQLILNYQKGALDLRVQYRGRTPPLDVIARREHALRSIAAWKVVLSPVRRLPCEVLSEIFVFCVVPALRSRSTSADDPREPPILMSHVCALWRNVALNTPRLWYDLIFLFSKGLPKRRTIPILEELIHRSTPHGLRTYIDSDSFSFSDSPDILRQLIAIPEFAPRVQTLHLKMGITHFEDLLHVPTPIFLDITTLRLDICISRKQQFVGRILEFFESPTLRELTIRCTYWEDSFCISLSPHFPWAQLVDLDLDVALKAVELVRILTQCINLRRCGLFSLPSPNPQPDLAICTLPNLQNLIMHGWECTYWPFEIFRFPNLTLLDLTLGKWPTEALLSLQVAPTFMLTHLSLHSTEKAVLRDGGEGLVQMIESRCYLDLRPSGAPPFAQLWDFCLKCWKPKFSVSVQERLAYLEEDGVFRWWD
ncbi:hypothetical protein B0H13DRAFT_2306997 [Mycena leptocephala]|nr:hypothetical protein B0H13DRAFT_2306997 [Mycena leptocephala]